MSLVGIVTALRIEARCITPIYLPYNEMTRLSDNSAVWLCGMGYSAARTAATGLIKNGATALVSFGMAGALEAELRPGDLVLPEEIQAYRFLLSSKKKLLTYPVSLEWRNNVVGLLSPYLSIVGGKLTSSSHILTNQKAKLELAAMTGACAVDMESAAIAEVAAGARVPFLAIRAISDPVEHSPPIALTGAIHSEGSVKMISLLSLLLRRSVNFSTLFRLNNEARAARNTLSAVVRHTNPKLTGML